MPTIDYRTFSDNGRGAPGVPEESKDRRWWDKKDPDDAAHAVTASIELLKAQQSRRIAQHVVSARLYGNLPASGLGGVSLDKLAAQQSVLRDRTSYNGILSVVDTLQSKLSKNRPKPYHLTAGGDYRAQRKAKLLNHFVEGTFAETKAYDEGADRLREALVFGDAYTQVFEGRDGRVAHQTVLASELWLDEVEAFYGLPRTIQRTMDVDRDELAGRFPKKRDVIWKAQTSANDDRRRTQTISDMITVRESWHLRSGTEAKDGKHLISIDGHALTGLEAWEHDFFPFARLRWSPRLWGYWSQGIPEQIQNLQVELNKLMWLIQRSLHLGSNYKVMLQMGSKIVKEAINNEIGGLIYYQGAKPEWVAPAVVNPELFAQVERLIRLMYEQSGISTLNATSQKPAGLNSGKALREMDDIGADRFLTPAQRYQRYYLDLARLDIAVAADIAARNGGEYGVRVPGRRYLKVVDWSDVDLSEDQYLMQCFPVSSLPSDPAGRLQTVQEYMQAGLLTQRQGRKLLDFPDIERVEDLWSAGEDYLAMILDKMVDEGKYTPPEPMDDLQLAMELVHEYYMDGKTHGLGEERLDLLRTFKSQIEDLVSRAQPPPQAPGGPMAAPAPTPTSDLIPNVQQAA